MPVPVSRYMQLIKEKGYEKRSGKEGFCAGCMLDRGGVHGYIGAYELIHPVNLDSEARALSAPTMKLSTLDTLHLDLLDSGAFVEENEGWEDVLGRNFEDSDPLE